MALITGSTWSRGTAALAEGINYNDARISQLLAAHNRNVEHIDKLTKQVNALVKIANKG